jgi:hypothetical protein
LKTLLSKFNLQDRSEAANIGPLSELRKITDRSVFFATSELASPTNHLLVLRGPSSNTKLHCNDYMSPSLHNSSDTYHRHLRSQLFQYKAIRQGEHSECLSTTSVPAPINDFGFFLESYAQSFLHGYQNQLRKDAEENDRHENRKEFFIDYEATEMRLRA